jgi:hypothetical protein
MTALANNPPVSELWFNQWEPDPRRWPQEDYSHECGDLAAAMLDGDRSDRDVWGAGILLVGALHVGPRNKRLRAYLGCSERALDHYAYRFRKYGIWQGEIMHAPWLEDDCSDSLAAVSFLLDAMVGAGRLLRSHDASGEPIYRVALLSDLLGIPMTVEATA